MKLRLSKMLWTSLFAVLSSIGVSGLSAAHTEQQPCFINQCDPCYGNFCCEPVCCDEPCISIWGDVLVWNACRSDTDYALRDGPVVAGPHNNSSTQFVDADWDAGFRVGLSYGLWDCLSLNVIYTYWHPKEHDSVSAAIGGVLYPTTFPGSVIAGSTATAASAQWKLNYNLLDVVFAKTIRCGDCAKVRPYAGVRTLFFKETFKVEYTGGSFATAGDGSRYGVDFTAVGFTAGVQGKYHICGGVSFIGHLGGSILGGDPKQHQDWFKATPVQGTAQTRHNVNKHCVVLGEWDASVGLAYDTCCCNWPVGFAIGYEVQDWWNVPRARRFFDNVAAGVSSTDANSRLTIHGAFVRGSVSF